MVRPAGCNAMHRLDRSNWRNSLVRPEENMDEAGQELSDLVRSCQKGAGLIVRFLVETVKRLPWFRSSGKIVL
jgi:hypothetical protein